MTQAIQAIQSNHIHQKPTPTQPHNSPHITRCQKPIKQSMSATKTNQIPQKPHPPSPNHITRCQKRTTLKYCSDKKRIASILICILILNIFLRQFIYFGFIFSFFIFSCSLALNFMRKYFSTKKLKEVPQNFYFDIIQYSVQVMSKVQPLSRHCSVANSHMALTKHD